MLIGWTKGQRWNWRAPGGETMDKRQGRRVARCGGGSGRRVKDGRGGFGVHSCWCHKASDGLLNGAAATNVRVR